MDVSCQKDQVPKNNEIKLTNPSCTTQSWFSVRGDWLEVGGGGAGVLGCGEIKSPSTTSRSRFCLSFSLLNEA